ncbi:MarR family winged helix-turn-helix transcriptional regulator [Nonomuraea sp. M3C6]|uniref:MarR family winged helix-turn-helix transcriptional regulator n=1 Tax=Nonomuraea marmarensis TaxID=3351344 RepID=A0ABW7ACN9_9ACTN
MGSDQDLGWALGMLLRAYLKGVGDVVAELPGGPRAYQVLAFAEAGSCQNQAQMADLLGIDRTAMTYLLDDLEALRLLFRHPDPVDRRSRRVVLTPKGKKLLNQLTEQVRQVEQHLLASLGDAQAEQLRITLGLAAQALANPKAPESACQVVESLDLHT